MFVGELPEPIREFYHMVFNYAEKHNMTFEQAKEEILSFARDYEFEPETKTKQVTEVLTYTGVGSRDISEEEWNTMEAISKWLSSQNYVLRSGKAPGSDSAFESGVELSENKTFKEIYIPWKGFEGNELPGETIVLDPPSSVNYGISLKLVREIHPAPDKLKQGAAKLHQRNCHQVLGRDLEKPIPSKFLLACAEEDRDGNVKGGTRTAWMLAKKYNIPCFNIRGKTKKEIFAFLKTVM